MYAMYRVRVEFFTNEKSFKERLQVYFVKNQRSSTYVNSMLYQNLFYIQLYFTNLVKIGTDRE